MYHFSHNILQLWGPRIMRKMIITSASQLHQLSYPYNHIWSHAQLMHIKTYSRGVWVCVSLRKRKWRTKGSMHCLNHMQWMEERELIAILKTPTIRYSLIFNPTFFSFPVWFVPHCHSMLSIFTLHSHGSNYDNHPLCCREELWKLPKKRSMRL